MARRWCAFLKGHLLFWVDDWYYANLARIGYIELTAGKPLIEEPSPSRERSRGRCTHKFSDCVGLHSVKEGSQNSEIYSFPLQSEDEVSFESVTGAMTRREHLPRWTRGWMVTFGNSRKLTR
jgi:hypothetical protein